MPTRRADLRRAARSACRTLLAIGDPSLPVDVLEIARRCKNTRCLTYSQAARYLDSSVYGMATDFPSQLACTLLARDDRGATRYLILYNDDVCFGNSGSRRWSLAHELGHIVLGHDTNCPAFEREANCFAQYLLCPRPVLEAMPTRDEDIVCYAFGVSFAAARIALGALKSPSTLLDQDMRDGLAALYALNDKRTLEDYLSPARAILAAARRRRIAKEPCIIK